MRTFDSWANSRRSKEKHISVQIFQTWQRDTVSGVSKNKWKFNKWRVLLRATKYEKFRKISSKKLGRWDGYSGSKGNKVIKYTEYII